MRIYGRARGHWRGEGAQRGGEGGGEAAMSQPGGAQRLAFRGKEPKKTNASSARARIIVKTVALYRHT